MKKFLNRFTAFLMTCILCVSLENVAFAAESQNIDSAPSEINVVKSEIATHDVGAFITGQSKNFTNECTIVIVTSSANVDADFFLTVQENNLANYEVTMYAPSGATASDIIGCGGGSAHFTMALAPAGTYTFTFKKHSGVANPATAFVQIFD